MKIGEIILALANTCLVVIGLSLTGDVRPAILTTLGTSVTIICLRLIDRFPQLGAAAVASAESPPTAKRRLGLLVLGLTLVLLAVDVHKPTPRIAQRGVFFIYNL